MRRTALSLMPVAVAIIAALRWVASTGGFVIGKCYHALGHFGPQGWNSRRARFVTEKTIDAFLHEPLLPAPDARLGHATSGAWISCVPTPSTLTRTIAGSDTCFCAKLRSLTTPSRRRRSEEPTVHGNSGAHTPDVANALDVGNPKTDSSVRSETARIKPSNCLRTIAESVARRHY